MPVFFDVIFIFIFYGVMIIVPVFFIFVLIRSISDSIRIANTVKFFQSSIIVPNNRKDFQDTTNGKKNIYKDVPQYKLDRLDVDDIDTLKDYLFDIFYKFEMAYNNLDYNEMRILTTKQLFQKYHTGISLNLKVGKKKVINDVKREKMTIYEVDSTSAKQVVSAMVVVSYINYTLDKNGYVISGNKLTPAIERFEIEFRKDFEKEELSHCPNCGAKITGNKCEYCKSIIDSNDFKICSIRRIVDR